MLLGTLPIVLALPLPGAAALAITSLSVPPPPVAPERQGMLQAKHPCSPPCQVALVPQRPAHPTATTTESRRHAVESLLHVAAAAAVAECDISGTELRGGAAHQHALQANSAARPHPAPSAAMTTSPLVPPLCGNSATPATPWLLGPARRRPPPTPLAPAAWLHRTNLAAAPPAAGCRPLSPPRARAPA